MFEIILSKSKIQGVLTTLLLSSSLTSPVQALEASLETIIRIDVEPGSEKTAEVPFVFTDTSLEVDTFRTIEPGRGDSGSIGATGEALATVFAGNTLTQPSNGLRGDVGVRSFLDLGVFYDGDALGAGLESRAIAESRGTLMFSGPASMIPSVRANLFLDGQFASQVLGAGEGSLSQFTESLDIVFGLGNRNRFTGRSFTRFQRQVQGGTNIPFEDTVFLSDGLLEDYQGGPLPISVLLEDVPVGVPLEVTMSIRGDGFVTFGASNIIASYFQTVTSEVDYLNTFGFAEGLVFDLPEGFTVNSEDYGIIDNVRSGNPVPEPSKVPEPSSILGVSVFVFGTGFKRKLAKTKKK